MIGQDTTVVIHRKKSEESVKFSMYGNVTDQRGRTLCLGLQNGIIKSLLDTGGKQHQTGTQMFQQLGLRSESISCTCSGRVTVDANVAQVTTEDHPSQRCAKPPATEANGAATDLHP